MRPPSAGRPRTARRRSAALLTLTALLPLAPACGGHDDDHYRVPARAVRDGEHPLPYREVTDGHIAFAAIGLSSGLTTITGSHADLPSRLGGFARVRMLAENRYATFHKIDLDRQLLVTSRGAYPPDVNAMRVKRQPTDIELGSHDRLEFDLMYDIPKDARITALRLYADPTDELGVPLQHDPGAELPLR
ncbi:DUF4352 domain-containing protein [Actinomadura sp. LD22]|uniref:DUF4352 domain-containing protein n=1 Tax=Actinomadura physcomitrii TaxID=2650748 RepID=A0A6I4MXX4_9ACTN|nr:DUF4352 domain-containing protein [Actinomadura physcomitrii]MWA07449.1 DUF4352 domain-containing protein [Actinomadura physcomitrii]